MTVLPNDRTYAMSYGGPIGENDTPIEDHKLITAIHESSGAIESVETETIDGQYVAFETSHTSADIGTTLADVNDVTTMSSATTVSAGIDAAASIGGEAKILANQANTALSNKVDKVTGKGLSTNDFTGAYKDKIDGMQTPISTVSTSPSTGVVSMTYTDTLGNEVTSETYTTDVVDGIEARLPLVVKYSCTIDESEVEPADVYTYELTTDTTYDEILGALESGVGIVCTLEITYLGEQEGEESVAYYSGFNTFTSAENEIQFSMYNLSLASIVGGDAILVELIKIIHTKDVQYGETAYYSYSDHVVPIAEGY